MWDWAEPALQYGSGPVIAAVALLWQQSRTDQREEKRRDEDRRERELDRQHQSTESASGHAGRLELAESEQRAAIRERWRDERKDAYANLMEQTERGTAAFSRVLVAVRQEDHELFNELLREAQAASEDARSGLAQVQIIGSDGARTTAAEVVQRMYWARFAAMRVDLSGEEDRLPNIDKFVASVEALDKAQVAYLTAARADLEVD